MTFISLQMRKIFIKRNLNGRSLNYFFKSPHITNRYGHDTLENNGSTKVMNIRISFNTKDYF